MKKALLAFALAAPFLAAPAHAKPAVIGTVEKVIKLADLPNVDELAVNTTPAGYQVIVAGKSFLDVGYCYKQLQVVFLPVWNWDERYCGYVNDNTYADVSHEELRTFAKTLSADTAWDDGKSKISLWERVGGKVVLAGIIGLLLGIRVWRKRRQA